MLAEAPVSFKDFILHTIETRGGIITPQDGTLENIYPWGTTGAMARAEHLRLDLQGKMIWAPFYEHSHRELPQLPILNRMALIGVSGGAGQVKSVLTTHPTTEVTVVEIDPNKCRMAEDALLRTNPGDVKSGRLRLINAEGGAYLAEHPGEYDYVEADKVAVHLPVPLRKALYQGAETALKPGGLFYERDLLVATWRACTEEGYKKDNSTRHAVAVLGRLMPKILDNIWTKRGAPLWKTIDDMSAEPPMYAPNLVPDPSLTRSCQAPFTPGSTTEGLISQFIALMPALGIEMARLGQPNNPVLAKEADDRWNAAEQFIAAANTPGVQIALPWYHHLAFKKK